jgi:hypothetical protein
MVWVLRLRRELLVIGGAVVTALFGASDLLDLIGGSEVDRYLFLVAFLIFAAGVILRILMLDARIDERQRYKDAIDKLTPFLTSGNQVLEMCARPESIRNPVDPMLWQNHCIPRINQWHWDATPAVREFAPEYLGKFENDGNVYLDADRKPVMIQQLEGRLKRLDEILDALRAKL